VLDAGGNPVVGFYDGDNATSGVLKLLHCNDANCDGGDDSIETADGAGHVGREISLVLDAAGYPVMVYEDVINDKLKVTHCNDADCAGGDESTTTPDNDSNTILPSGRRAIALDADGYPVIVYQDVTNDLLKLMHCNDEDCAGGDESIVLPDPTSEALSSSLALDAFGNPVVAYQAHVGTQFETMVLHCDDVNCDPGSDSISAPAPALSGEVPTILLDSAGYPVVSSSQGGSPALMHCNDANCSGGDESIEVFDTVSNISVAPFALDASGVPVVTYKHYGPYVIHCADPFCTADLDGDDCADVSEQNTDGATLKQGGLRSPKNPYDYFNPTHDGQNRIDDVVAVLGQYFIDSGHPNYNPDTDRTLTGPNLWNTGPPNGLQRVDDIVNQLNQYFHDCA
jgi:hypothetical protein